MSARTGRSGPNDSRNSSTYGRIACFVQPSPAAVTSPETLKLTCSSQASSRTPTHAPSGGPVIA
ncbi:MAG: hypothetical protein ACYCR4_06315 [Acidimicrobiales bacterium]